MICYPNTNYFTEVTYPRHMMPTSSRLVEVRILVTNKNDIEPDLLPPNWVNWNGHFPRHIIPIFSCEKNLP